MSAQAVSVTDAATFKGFVYRRADPDALAFTDESGAYRGLRRAYIAVKRGISEFAREQARVSQAPR